jgi:adenylate cyclase
MKYRTKLYLAFSGLLVGAIVLVQGITYFESKQRFLEMMRMRVLGIATNGASSLDKADIQAVKASLDDKSDAFKSLIRQMRDIRDANRNNMFFVEYIYLVSTDPKNSQQLIVIADASEGPVYAQPGTLYPEGISIGILNHLNENFAPSHIEMDRWGSFLPGYAPIYTSDGKYLATLGVNISAEFVNRDLNRMKWIALFSMLIALGAGALVATWLANRLSRSLVRISESVSKYIREGTPIDASSFEQDEVGDLARSIRSISVIREEREQLKAHFYRNVSKPVMDKILQGGKLPFMEGEKRKITVLCSDILNFTHFTEILPPEQVVIFLNEFMTVMYDVIFAHNGTVDKVVGDGLVVEFGAPVEDPSQEINAIETAVEMQTTLQKLNKKWESEGRPEISMSIGIHSDQGILANIGAETRKEYTAVGNAVNTALRIRDAAKRLEVPILVSEATWIPIRHRFESKDMGPLYLKGKTNPVKVYAIELPKN